MGKGHTGRPLSEAARAFIDDLLRAHDLPAVSASELA